MIVGAPATLSGKDATIILGMLAKLSSHSLLGCGPKVTCLAIFLTVENRLCYKQANFTKSLF
jgi:hypothetical protein